MVTDKIILLICGRQMNGVTVSYVVGDSPTVAANNTASLIAVSSIFGDKMLKDLLTAEQYAVLENPKKNELSIMVNNARFLGDNYGNVEDKIALDKLLAKI